MSKSSDGACGRRHPLLVRTVRGLEAIAAAEVRARLASGAVVEGHRELRFVSAQLRGALTLGVADDVFLVVLDAAEVGRPRSELRRIAEQVAGVDLDRAAAVVRRVRPVRGRAFDVAASFLGPRNYSRFDIEDSVGEALARSTGWRYESRRHGRPVPTALSLRAHLARQCSLLGVRLAAEPLHRRRYRVASRPGALHPPVGHALVLAAEPRGGDVLLDPFCGTGTIPIEAKLRFPDLAVRGSDLDPAAVAAARANAAAAGIAGELGVEDAARLAVARGSVGCIVTNPPWGRGVRARGGVERSLAPFWGEADRVLSGEGRLAVLLPHAARLPVPGSTFEVVLEADARVAGALVRLVALRRR